MIRFPLSSRQGQAATCATIVTLSALLLLVLLTALASGATAHRSSYRYQSAPRGSFSSYAYSSSGAGARLRPMFGASAGFPGGLVHLLQPPRMPAPFGNFGGLPEPAGGADFGMPAFYPAPPPSVVGPQYYPVRSSRPSRPSLSSSSSSSSSSSGSSGSPSSSASGSSGPAATVESAPSSANSSNRPSNSRPGSAYGPRAPAVYRRPPPPVAGGYTAAPAAPSAPVNSGRVRPLATSPAPASTSSGALGPTVSNDADIGFDIPASSNSDSSSLAGPTVSAAGAPRTGPLTSAAGSSSSSSSLVSADGFDRAAPVFRR